MKKIKSFISEMAWVRFVSKRFSRVDRKGRSKVTTFLASAGIGFGVMTLIVVLSVMNGFQMSFIDSIMEVSSYHVRAEQVSEEQAASLMIKLEQLPEVKSVTPFYEAQSLMVGKYGSQHAALIRCVPENIMEIDSGFKKEAKIWTGDFDLSQENSIVLGTELARRLGLRKGSTVNLFALSGGNEVNLISNERIFTVTGLVRTGYSDINASYAFINIKDGEKYLGNSAPLSLGIKLNSSESDQRFLYKISQSEDFSGIPFDSWRNYNRSFFSTLKIEKNMLLLLVFLIFIVVAINIKNGMRRMVFERREEISILSALGANPQSIQWIFIVQGMLIGLSGAIPGLLLGLFLSIKMSTIFMILSKISYFFQRFFFMLLIPDAAPYVKENPMYVIYANIPPRLILSEVFLITIFGIFSALIASWVASRNVLKFTVAEVLRDE